MREVDVSRLALLIALALFGIILLGIAGLVIEAFMKGQDSAEWASAIGGFLAVLAASIIAIAQSRQARRTSLEQARLHTANLQVQAQMHAAGIEAQKELTAASLKLQEKLQRASFSFQRSAVRDALQRDRASAVAAISAAYGLVADIVRCLEDDSGPTAEFVSVWTADAELAIQLARSVQYGHLAAPQDMVAHGSICVFVSDAWTSIKEAQQAKSLKQRLYHRALAKTWVLDIQPWLQQLDAQWEDSDPEPLKLTPEEEAELNARG